MPLLGVVPDDSGVTRIDLDGQGVFSLAEESPALAAVSTLMRTAVPALAQPA